MKTKDLKLQSAKALASASLKIGKELKALKEK